jgi:hypothetical protein
MNKLKITAFSIIVALGLTGCGDDSSSSNNSSTIASSSSTVGKQATSSTDSSKSFRYTWLEGVESSSMGEDVMFDTNYYFIVDGSGSMDGNSCEGGGLKIDVAKKAISEYVQTLSDNVNIGLFAFDGSGVTERSPLMKNNKTDFVNKLNQVAANSTTPLKSAITAAYAKMKVQGMEQGSRGEYNMIIVTDGEADSFEDPKKIIKEIGSNSPINITTIGFCIDSSHSLNDKNYVHYYSARSYESMMQGLTAVQAEGEDVSETELLESLDYLADL